MAQACSGRRPWRWVLAIVLAGSPFVGAGDDEEDRAGWTFGALLDARLRYEMVDDDGSPNRANAVTLRTRLGFVATCDRCGSGLLEFEDVSGIGSDRYNSTANGMGGFPVVADPDATEINRAWWSYVAPGDVALKLGRQRIVRDKGRMIGDVGWRQNQQTFDALTAGRNEGRFGFWAGYLARANRIFGEQHPNPVMSEFELQGWVGEGEARLKPGTVTAILHYLEFENDPARSHRNIGLRWLGKAKLDGGNAIVYRAQYIDQAPHSSGATINEADYVAAEVGYKAERWGAGVNAEILGGDGVYGFQRPLATLHAYNGWADRFLNTPAEGLFDLYVTGNAKIKGCNLSGQIHRYESDFGDIHFGDEYGVAVAHKFRKRYAVVLKVADFHAGDVGVDVQKIWLSIGISEKFKLGR